MLSSEYCCAKATACDDTGLIAKYIYLTDPYIYPCIYPSHACEEWQRIIKGCLSDNNSIYSLDTVSVAKHNNSIIGVACVIPCGKQLTFIDSDKIPTSIQQGLNTAIEGYFKPLIEESANYDGYNIINVCVDPDYRGQGVGSLIMEHCISEYGSKTLHLDVIASNLSAIALYSKFGFTIESKYMGFSGNDIGLECYHMIRR